MSNVRFYPDENSVIETRDEDDVVYLVISEKDWNDNLFFGFSASYYSIACQYARKHSDTNWVITFA